MAATLEKTIPTIEERLEELRDEADGLRSLMDDLCDGCEEVRHKTYYEEFWGARVPVEEQVCEKGERSCGRSGEYEEMEERLEAVLKEIASLEGAVVAEVA